MAIRHSPQRRPLNKLMLLAASAASLLFLAGCAGMGPGSTAAQRELASSNSTGQTPLAQFKACTLPVRARPEFAPLLPHLPDPVTEQFSMAQMTDETRPTAREAALFAALSDAQSGCFRTVVAEVQSVRPDVATIMGNQRAAVLQVQAQLVERRVTWAEYARQVQRIGSEASAQIAAANQQWTAEANAQNQAELNRRNAVSMQYMANQQAINAQTMNAMRPIPLNPGVHCTSLMTGPLVSTNCN